MNYTHKSAWYSPRGFANEGTYVYGTVEEIDDFFEESVSGDANCEWSCTMSYGSEEAALNDCEKQARIDKSLFNDYCAINVSHVNNMVKEY